MLRRQPSSEGLLSAESGPAQPAPYGSALAIYTDQDRWKDTESIPSSADDGVRDVEAIVSVWSKWLLIFAYASVYLVSFGNSLEQAATSNLTSYVTSDFSRHPLVSTVSIMSTIIGGVARVPIARLIDTWGRGEGFVAMVTFTTLGTQLVGLILMAACTNVSTYAAAQVFYWLGYEGILYVVQVFLADTSTLKNRAIVFAFSSTPYIFTTFAGPAAAQFFQTHLSWRWAFGTFAIITPFMSLPVTFLLFHTKRKAIRLGLIRRRERQQQKPWAKVVKKFLMDLDAVGATLFIAGYAFIFLPLSTLSSKDVSWHSAGLISRIVAGCACFGLFVIWEWRYTPSKLIPYNVVMDRTILASCLLCACVFWCYSCYHTYMSSFLQVVHNLSIRDAGYISNIFSITSCIFGIFVAWAISATGRYKWLGFVGLPLLLLGTTLMVSASQPNQKLAFLVTCQVLNALAGSTFNITNQMAVMAASSHSHLAVVLALLLLFASIGDSIGTATAGAIWNSSMPDLLERFLPVGSKKDAGAIFGSLKKQLSYAWGSPERTAIIKAYCNTQSRLCFVSACVLPMMIFFVCMWRNLPLREEEIDDRSSKADSQE
ncbi:MFS general substrate transporter [Phyllosticta citrichinensis]